MRPVSQGFLDALRGSHGMRARARVVSPGLTGTNPGPLNPDGSPVYEIPVEAGDVKLDATADIRGSLDITTIYDWPEDENGLLTPYGNELFVERGVALTSGAIEWVSLGYFRIDDVDQDEAADGPIQIVGLDRMAGIVDAKTEAPRQFSAGASVQSVFTTLVQEVYPTAVIVFDWDASAAQFTTSHVLEEDRYKFLKDIADSYGKVMFWDYQGRLQVKTAPDPKTAVWDVTHGRDGVLVRASRSLSRKDSFNAVVASGEAAGETPPVRSVVYDTNPLSPTRWGGPFGKVPLKITSSMIETEEQATAAALAKLTRSLGVPYSVDFQSIPNPALEPLDPVCVSYTDRRPEEIHVVETLTIPLTADGVMAGTTRKQVWGGVSGA